MGCYEGERGKILSLMAGRYVDRVKFTDCRKVCRQGEVQEWAAGRESGERSCH